MRDFIGGLLMALGAKIMTRKGRAFLMSEIDRRRL